MTDARASSASQEAARTIYQDGLDGMVRALADCDPDQWMQHVKLPLKFSTAYQSFIIESLEDFMLSVRGTRQNFDALGVTQVFGLVTDADFLGEGYIEGIHTTYTLKDGHNVTPPYETRMTFARVDNQWRVTAIEAALRNKNWPIVNPQVDAFTPKLDKAATPGDDARRKTATPLTIYQRYLDRLSRTNMEDDFEGWCALCAFPHSVHINEVDDLIETPDQIAPFFEMLRGFIREHAIDRLDRVASAAEFVSPTEICGYHTTTLLSDGEVKLGPVDSRYILKRAGIRWQMSSVTNSISNSNFPYAVPHLSSELVTLREIQKRTQPQ